MTSRPPRPPRPVEACLLCRCRWDEDRTTWRWPRAQVDHRTCKPCADHLATEIQTIPAGIARLSAERLVGDGRQRPGGYCSTSPANDLAIALLDPRNGPVVDAGDVPDALGQLHAWARLVREEAQLPPGNGTVTAGLLLGQLPWITKQAWVDDFAREMYQLAECVRAANGEATQTVRLGPCPHCERTLTARVGANAITCECGDHYPRSMWAWLGRQMVSQ